jgi:hypothetical protein
MSAETKPTAAEAKAAPTPKIRMAKAQRPRFTPKGEKLVCRYCSSDDLAPSFIRRRDARCRACFKKRYGSTMREKNAVAGRKTKAAKE